MSTAWVRNFPECTTRGFSDWTFYGITECGTKFCYQWFHEYFGRTNDDCVTLQDGREMRGCCHHTKPRPNTNEIRQHVAKTLREGTL